MRRWIRNEILDHKTWVKKKTIHWIHQTQLPSTPSDNIINCTIPKPTSASLKVCPTSWTLSTQFKSPMNAKLPQNVQDTSAARVPQLLDQIRTHSKAAQSLIQHVIICYDLGASEINEWARIYFKWTSIRPASTSKGAVSKDPFSSSLQLT